MIMNDTGGGPDHARDGEGRHPGAPDRARQRQLTPGKENRVPAELTFIGTATTLLEIGPFMILTDPNFLHHGERAYLGYGLWSKRLTEPALTPAQLPPVDVIVLSHLHGDHWDRRSRHEVEMHYVRRGESTPL
jgi:hypothetical protein